MIQASAPAKIILFGEHAVVYGRPAIAAPVHSLSATAQIEPIEDVPRSRLLVNAPDIELTGWLHEMDPEATLAQILRKSLELFEADDFRAFRLQIESDIPPASGLGSSAATSVAILRAMAEYLQLDCTNEMISDFAYELEKIHHGTPSGIDNSVVAHSQLIYFVREETARPLRAAQPISLVIADSGIPAPTALAVGQVREAWKSDQGHFEDLFSKIGAVAQGAKRALEIGDRAELGMLMNQNQVLLQEIGVSSSPLEKLVSAARSAGSLGAKLSGAGLGGNVIALIEPESAEDIERALREAGAHWTRQTTIEI